MAEAKEKERVTVKAYDRLGKDKDDEEILQVRTESQWSASY